MAVLIVTPSLIVINIVDDIDDTTIDFLAVVFIVPIFFYLDLIGTEETDHHGFDFYDLDGPSEDKFDSQCTKLNVSELL